MSFNCKNESNVFIYANKNKTRVFNFNFFSDYKWKYNSQTLSCNGLVIENVINCKQTKSSRYRGLYSKIKCYYIDIKLKGSFILKFKK